MIIFRIMCLAFLSLLAMGHTPSAAASHDILLQAAYMRTDNALLSPQEAWESEDLKPARLMQGGEAGSFVWVMADLEASDLNPDHNVLFMRSLSSRRVEVFIYTEGLGWDGPYPHDMPITGETHPAATTIIRLPVTFDGQHRIAIKLTDPLPSMVLRGISLMSEEASAHKESQLETLYQIALTIIAVAFSYNLFLYIVFRHRFQVYYLIYTFSLLCYVGLLSQMVIPIGDWLDGRQQYDLRTVFYSLTAMGIYLFASEITRTEFPGYLRKALMMAAFLPLMVNIADAIMPLGAIRVPLYDVFGTLGLVIFFIGAIQVIPRGAPITRLVLIAFLIPSIALIIKIAHGYSGNDPSFWIDNIVVIATAIENIVVALIIAERLIAYSRKDTIDNTL